MWEGTSCLRDVLVFIVVAVVLAIIISAVF